MVSSARIEAPTPNLTGISQPADARTTDGQQAAPQTLPQRSPSPASQEVQMAFATMQPLEAAYQPRRCTPGLRPPMPPLARPTLTPLRLPSPYSGPLPPFSAGTNSHSGRSSAGGDSAHYWSTYMDPRDVPPHISSRLVPGLVDPDNPRNVISLHRFDGYKQLGGMSVGANRSGAKRFRAQYARWVEPLFDAFERVHGFTPKEAWMRRHEAEESEARKRLKLDLQNARAQGAKEAQQEMQRLAQENCSMTTFGNRQSLSRYANQRLALYFEVNKTSTALRAWPTQRS